MRTAGWMLGTALFLALPVAAADEAPRGPCQQDVKRLCADVEPGAFSLLRCLRTHEDELGGECRAALTGKRSQATDRLAEIGEACQSELQRYCPERRGPMHMMRCLHDHEADLSDSCRAALPPKPSAAKPPAEAPEPSPEGAKEPALQAAD